MKIQTFDYSANLLQSILWQYNNSTNIISLLSQKQDWFNLNVVTFWTNWYTDVFDLRTCNEFGIIIWSIILNLPLYLNINPDPPDKPVFGFNENPTINSYVNFENGNFSNQNPIALLTLEEERILLRVRYFQLTCRGAIAEINTFFDYLFGDLGGAWVEDNFDMTITYTFNFDISDELIQVMSQTDVLPRPAGVGIIIVTP